MLGFAVVFEAGALWFAFREFNLSRGSLGIVKAIKHGKDPTLFVVVFEDSAALLGLLIALIGMFLYQITGNPIFDGMASISIGVLLIFTAFVLAVESKNLLIGESAEPRIVASIHKELATDDRVSDVNEVATLHMGPDFIVAPVSTAFVDTLSASELESAVTDMTKRIKRIDPRLQRVFIEAERGQDHDPED